MIKLGSKAKDRVTGFEGIVIGHSQWLSGCDRYIIQPPAKDGAIPAAQSFDVTDVVILETPEVTGIKAEHEVVIKTEETPQRPGGPAPHVGRW